MLGRRLDVLVGVAGPQPPESVGGVQGQLRVEPGGTGFAVVEPAAFCELAADGVLEAVLEGLGGGGQGLGLLGDGVLSGDGGGDECAAALVEQGAEFAGLGDHRVYLRGLRVEVVGDAALLVEGREGQWSRIQCCLCNTLCIGANAGANGLKISNVTPCSEKVMGKPGINSRRNEK